MYPRPFWKLLQHNLARSNMIELFGDVSAVHNFYDASYCGCHGWRDVPMSKKTFPIMSNMFLPQRSKFSIQHGLRDLQANVEPLIQY